jgi:hypothetical protein
MSKDLTEIVPPPKNPIHRGSVAQIQGLSKKLGIMLPRDYVEYGCLYGDGILCSEVWRFRVLNPFSPTYRENLMQYNDEALACLAFGDEYRDAYLDDVPRTVFPEVGGLLCFARSDTACLLAFVAEGDPSEWPIIAIDKHGEHERHDATFTDFLYSVFSQQRECFLFLDSWENLNFMPSELT